MKSAFFEFHVATTGLFTARANLQVMSHNISNVETPGYSRQYAMQRANTPIALYNGKGMVGTGSEVYGVGQIRNIYLDKKYWSERAVLGEYGNKRVQLNIMEAVFNDLSEGGLTGVFNDFFDNLQSLSENAGDATYRTNLIQSSETLISLVKYQATALQKQQLDINVEIKAIVGQINSIGQQILSLNRQIKTLEADGSVACDLRDARALLVDELSKYVNVEVTEKEMNEDYAAGKYPDDPSKSDKRFVVLINGYELVNHFTITTLNCVPRTSAEIRNAMDAPNLYKITRSNGTDFDIYHPMLKGDLKGLIDVRDGNNAFPTAFDTSNTPMTTTAYKGIPHYLNRLNELVRTFAMAVNEGAYYSNIRNNRFGGTPANNNNSIIGLDGGHFAATNRHVDETTGILGETGILFFSDYGSVDPNPWVTRTGTGTTLDPYIYTRNYNNLNVFNFTINDDIIKNPDKISAARPDWPAEPSDQSDNRMILALIKLKDDVHLFNEGKLEDYINSISSELGIDIKQAKKFESNYTDVTIAINNQRLSVSGVNADEEVVEMIKFQQLYQAAAKLINIIDMIYDTTINGLGHF